MDKRPPPYFPQTSLSPQDPNRYRKFKLIVGLLFFGAVLVLAGLGVGIYYFISWLFA